MIKHLLPIIFFSVSFAFAGSQTASDWESAKAQAASAIESHDCALAWRLIWPWAKKGQIDARAMLASGVVAAQLTPPGTGRDAVSRLRHAVILAVHGSAGGDPRATELLDGFLRIDIVSDMGGRALKQCLEAGRSRAICIDEAVKIGFVPDFDDYAGEIDILAARNGAAPASCATGNANGPEPRPQEAR